MLCIDIRLLNDFFGEDRNFNDFLEHMCEKYPEFFIKNGDKITSINIEFNIKLGLFSNNFKGFNFDIILDGVIFKEKVSFCNCNFKGKISFANCIFEKDVYFNNSTFENYLDFHESKFQQIACFYGVAFNKVPNFSACYFKEPKAVNLVNVNTDNLDFKKVENFIDDNYKDETYRKDIEQNENKEKETAQKYKLRYAQNAKDSFRVIKDILIEQNNILEAQEWHKLELYAKEKELEIKLDKKV